ncbi:hypothetical protein [Algoriphagus sp.]|uniref:hypothetical protein n=1 Tax=Algoriphagus sp. TaxID=1872435 RepID=UPI0026114E86|nr:hypothetical protein [Algoriphagus sp.]
MRKKTRYWVQSVGGLLLTGAGLSMSIDAGLQKLSGEPWFWYGTAGLIVFQTGLSLVIDGLRFKGKS